MAVSDKGVAAPSSSAVRMAQELLEACHVHTLPVNLRLLAKHQGIVRVRELDVRLDGQLLELEDGSYEVILSRSASSYRKRFTLAHEIAHTLLSSGKHSETLICGDAAVERLCNAMAAELLMPTRFLESLFSTAEEVTAQWFVRASNLFHCSLEATAWRLLNSGLVEGALQIWKTDDTQGTVELVTLPQTWGFQTPFVTGTLIGNDDPLWDILNGQEAGPMKLLVPGTSTTYHGDLLRLKRTILVFLRDVVSATRPRDEASPNSPSQGKLAF